MNPKTRKVVEEKPSQDRPQLGNDSRFKARCRRRSVRSEPLTPINGISKLTKLFSARKTQKIISNLLR